MDEATLHLSQADQETQFPFMTKQVVYIPDQNSGSYPNGQITFDCASLSNSGKFIDFNSSTLVIPLVMNVAITGAPTAVSIAADVFAASLKSSFTTLINSMSVELTNNSIVNVTNFSNLDMGYRLLSGSSFEDMQNFGQSIGFTKDTAESIFYGGVTGGYASGCGEQNNLLGESLFTPAGGWGATSLNTNKGRLQRMINTSFDPSQKAPFTSAALCSAIGKNYAALTTAATKLTNATYYILATLPLRILHPVFSKIPLMKGAYVRLIFNTNTQCSSAVTIAAGAYSTYATTSQNGTFPCMLSANTLTDGALLTGATAATLSLGIGKSVNGAFSHPTMTSCRLYANLFEMSPIYQEKYLEMVPTKRVVYNDILSFQVLNVARGGNFSQILTNGISRPRYLLLCCQIAAAIHGTAALQTDVNYTAGVGLLGSPMNSPFSSSPITTAPYGAISNFNVLVSGSALYQSNINYGFEHWLQEVRGSNAINGGIGLGLSSGILSQQDWEGGYRYIYVDLSRKASQSQDDISRSIQIIGTNSAAYAMDIFAIVGYEREFTVSTGTGSLVI